MAENETLGEHPPCPLHPKCRCILLPVTVSYKELGLDMDEIDDDYRPYIIRTERQANKNIDTGGKRKILETGLTQGDYSSFFSKQPASFQKNLVGKHRSTLISQGQLNFKDIVDPNTGRMRTLAELQNLRAVQNLPGPYSGVFALRDNRPIFSDAKLWPEKFENISKADLMKQADREDIYAQIEKDLQTIRDADFTPARLDPGVLRKTGLRKIMSNMNKELKCYSSYLSDDSMKLMKNFVTDFGVDLNDCILSKSAFLAGKEAQQFNMLGLDSIKKLVYQEVESIRQQFTDHGIRHIVGNIQRQKQILKILKKQGAAIDSSDYFLGKFIMVNHDIGYTTPLVRAGGLRGVKTSSMHKLFSTKITAQQKEWWDIGKIFDKDDWKQILTIIDKHDEAVQILSTAANAKRQYNMIHFATSTADNLALFQKEKLPALFKYVPDGTEKLMQMGIAAQHQDTTIFNKLKQELSENISKSKLSVTLQRDLQSALKEVSVATPKFTVGVLAGDVERLYSTSKSALVIDMNFNQFDTVLQKVFDMGQVQAKKFLKDYGITQLDKDTYLLGKFGDKYAIELHISGVPLQRPLTELQKKAIDYVRTKGMLYGDNTVAYIKQSVKKFEAYLAQQGLSPDDVMNIIENRKTICINMPRKNFDKFLDDKEFKNLFFGTDLTKTADKAAVASRGEWEKLWFGDDAYGALDSTIVSAANQQRPIYGHVSFAGQPFTTASKPYGEDIAVVLKDSIKTRTTMSIQDTAWTWKNSGNIMCNLDDTKSVYRSVAMSADNNVLAQGVSRVEGMIEYHKGNSIKAREADEKNRDYFEIQIHGGLNLSDIDHIAINSDIRKTIADLLEEKKRLASKGIHVPATDPLEINKTEYLNFWKTTMQKLRKLDIPIYWY